MNSIPPILYLLALAWIVSRSNKKLMTVVWSVVGFVATLAVALLLAVIIPNRAGAFGTLGALCGMLVSALVGFNYMKSHESPKLRRP